MVALPSLSESRWLGSGRSLPRPRNREGSFEIDSPSKNENRLALPSMSEKGSAGRFVFPKEANLLRPVLGISLVAVPIYLGLLVWLGGSPKTFAVGYQPEQPVPYSHALHAGELGINCRYCHTSVETAAQAAIPPTQTCMNCHAKIRAGSEKLIPVRESFATGLPVAWVKVHDLPQYVYFNHSAHVTRGVGCVEC